jgi:Tfp pilus assembly protein PilV
MFLEAHTILSLIEVLLVVVVVVVAAAAVAAAAVAAVGRNFDFEYRISVTN